MSIIYLQIKAPVYFELRNTQFLRRGQAQFLNCQPVNPNKTTRAKTTSINNTMTMNVPQPSPSSRFSTTIVGVELPLPPNKPRVIKEPIRNPARKITKGVGSVIVPISGLLCWIDFMLTLSTSNYLFWVVNISSNCQKRKCFWLPAGYQLMVSFEIVG